MTTMEHHKEGNERDYNPFISGRTSEQKEDTTMTVKEDRDTGTPASVETRLGTLDHESGYPTAETTRKLCDEMDFQRAVQAYLWAYPAVSFESI